MEQIDNMISEGGPIVPDASHIVRRGCRLAALRVALGHRKARNRAKVREWIGYARFWRNRVMHPCATHDEVLAMLKRERSWYVPAAYQAVGGAS